MSDPLKTEEVFRKLFRFINERLQKKHMPDPELVKEHNADPLNREWQIPEGALWEQSKVETSAADHEDP